MKETQKDIPIILIAGATDLRRKKAILEEVAIRKSSGEIDGNVVYGLCDKKHTTIYLMRDVGGGRSQYLAPCILKEPFPWPENKEEGKKYFTVKLTGEKKRKFLKDIEYEEVEGFNLFKWAYR